MEDQCGARHGFRHTLEMVNTENPCDEVPHSRQLAEPRHEEKMALETRFKWLDSCRIYCTILPENLVV